MQVSIGTLDVNSPKMALCRLEPLKDSNFALH